MSPVKKTKPAKEKEILQRSKTLKKKKRIGLAVILSCLFLALFGGMVFLFYWSALTVRNISVQGNSIVESRDITRDVNQMLEGKYWYLFPRRSAILYPNKEIEQKLLKDFPRLSEAQVGLSDLTSLMVDVKERDSGAVWCRDSSVEEGRSCYFSDNQGYIFAEAPYFSNSVFIELSGSLPEQTIGSTPLSAKVYGNIIQFAKHLPQIFERAGYKNSRLKWISIVDANDFEAYMVDPSATDNSGWKVYFNSDGDADSMAGTLYSVLTSDSFQKEMQMAKKGLESLDLRYGKKVFYKFRQ